jgi:hypothetical protein
VLAFLLGWMPLQAIALPLLALRCERDPASAHTGAVPGHHAQHADRSGHDHSGGSGGDDASPLLLHDCCHNLTSAALPMSAATSEAPAAGVEPTLLFHLFSFFPDRPKPPPLAA